jgi:hypothetical protein
MDPSVASVTLFVAPDDNRHKLSISDQAEAKPDAAAALTAKMDRCARALPSLSVVVMINPLDLRWQLIQLMA